MRTKDPILSPGLHRYKLIILIFFAFCTISPIGAQLQVDQLQCEYRLNPLGIDEIHPRLSWNVYSQNSKRQTHYRIIVSSSGKLLKSGFGDLWDTGKRNSRLTSNIIYSGKTLKSFQKCYWQVQVWDENDLPSEKSSTALFTVGPLGKFDWNAEWIGADIEFDKTNFPFIRKNVQLEVIPMDAYIHVNAIGYFELYINGKKVSNDILTPSVSDYSKHTLYITYDIKPYLKEGGNTIGIWLAHGWTRFTTKYFESVEEKPVVRALIQLDYQRDKRQFIATDRTWQYRKSNREFTGSWKWGNFGGEKVFLSQDINDWATLESYEKEWKQVDNHKVYDDIPVKAQRNNPTQILDSILPVEIQEIREKEYLVDFGKHLTGWIKFEFRGSQADSLLKIEYIDKITSIKSVTNYLERSFLQALNDRKQEKGYLSYHQQDIIVPARKATEVFQNKFNYHAFRWIKISGVDKSDIKHIAALQISEKNKQISTFHSSNPLLDNIWEAVTNTYRCINYNGYVVDCPHRERIGYGGDSHSSMETGLSIFDMAALYNKWTLDWNASNYPTGLWSHSAPEHPLHNYTFSPGWGGYGMFMPWQFYIYYGDTVNLSNAYPYIKRWMKYLESNTDHGILKKDSLRGGVIATSFLGDWVAPSYGMSPEQRVDQNSTNLFNNCFYLYELQMAQKIASILGKTEDSVYYSKLYQLSKPVIHKQFFDTDKIYYANGEQPYQVFPLLVGLVPDSLKNEIENYLEYLILDKNEGHLNTGMLGTYFLLEYLMKIGRNDLIYTMVNQRTFPGWGYMIENGATTIWEQWDGVNSQIHNCYLSIGKWFIQGLGGIQPDSERSGFQSFTISPGYIDKLESVDVSYETRYGKIVSNWENKPDLINHKIVVPVNTCANYLILDNNYKEILINGNAVKEFIKINNFDAINLEAGEHSISIIK